MKHKESKRDLEWSEQDLMDSMEKHRLNSNEGEGEKIFKNYMKINNTNIPAKEAAKMIEGNFKLNENVKNVEER